MTSRYLWRGALVFALSVLLASPARADTIQSDARNIVIGIVVVAAAIAVVVTVLIVHESKKDRTITGCVGSVGNGMTIANERDKKGYALTGNTVGINPGERVSLKGKRAKPNVTSQTPVWITTNVTKDFGVCQP